MSIFGFLAIISLLISIIIHLRFIKKYKVAIFVNGHIIEQFKTNFLPIKGDAINRVQQKKVYYVRNRIQRMVEDSELIILHCDDISNSLYGNNTESDSTGTVPQ